jgi:Flp pilus assembly protein TadG
MQRIQRFLIDAKGNAAAELAMVIPLMLTLMFGSLELGNLFLDEHALTKQVRDGARFASRLELSSTYDCSGGDIFAASDYDTQIINVTKNGAVTGTGTPRWTSYWDRTCDNGKPVVEVTTRCVPKTAIDTDDDGHTGIYTSLAGTDIPVVKVTANVQYRSVLSAIGIDATNVCLSAESEAAVAGS